TLSSATPVSSSVTLKVRLARSCPSPSSEKYRSHQYGSGAFSALASTPTARHTARRVASERPVREAAEAEVMYAAAELAAATQNVPATRARATAWNACWNTANSAPVRNSPSSPYTSDRPTTSSARRHQWRPPNQGRERRVRVDSTTIAVTAAPPNTASAATCPMDPVPARAAGPRSAISPAAG